MSSSTPDENVPFSPLLQFMETGWIHIVEALAVGLIVYLFVKLVTSYRSQATSNQTQKTLQTALARNQGLGPRIDSDLSTLTNISPKQQTTSRIHRASNPHSCDEATHNGSDDQLSPSNESLSEDNKKNSPLNHYIDDFFK